MYDDGGVNLLVVARLQPMLVDRRTAPPVATTSPET
jgi:hypothetical protein